MLHLLQDPNSLLDPGDNNGENSLLDPYYLLECFTFHYRLIYKWDTIAQVQVPKYLLWI